MEGWMGGWVDGGESRVKDCLQQSKIKIQKKFDPKKLVPKKLDPKKLDPKKLDPKKLDLRK